MGTIIRLPVTPATLPVMHDRDCLHRFLFEHYPIRGHIVHLDASWRALLEHRDYPPSIRDTDLRNRSYDIFCDSSGAVTTIDVTDGAWTSPTGPEDGSLNNFEVQYGDVTGDGVEDAFVNMDCSVGMGSNAWGNTVVLEPTTEGVHQVGQPIPSRTWLVDGKLIGETLYREESDPMCCPSSIDQSTWILRNGGWSQESTTRIPADQSLTYAGE